MATTAVFLPGKSHGQRSLVGYSPWGCKELEMTEQPGMHAWPRKGAVSSLQNRSLRWYRDQLQLFIQGIYMKYSRAGSFRLRAGLDSRAYRHWS